MTQEINYKVNAWLTTKGTFLDQMKAGGAAADTFSSKWSSAGARFSSVGRSIQGSTGAMVTSLAKVGALGAGVGAAGGLAAATKTGIGFNRMMEDTQITTATMFTAFNLGAQDAKVLSGETSKFAANMERASAMQSEIWDIAKRSPGTFRQANEAYSMMASGLSGATKDLERQKDILEKSVQLAGITEGDFRQLGSDVGRIVSGLAGLDVLTWARLVGPFGEAMAEVTQKEIPADLAKAFNQLAPEKRLQILEKVLTRIPPEVGEEYAKSFGGIVSAASSELEVMAGNFAKPLFMSMKTSLARLTAEGGILSGGTGAKLNQLSDVLGNRLANAFERGVSAMERVVTFIANNWETLWLKARQAAIIAATAIKLAMVAGVTRLVAGKLVSGIGVGMRAVGAAREGIGFARQKSAPAAMATSKAIASGMDATKRAFVFMAREAKTLPNAIHIGFLLTAVGFVTMIEKARRLPALVRLGLGEVKLAFGSMVAKAKTLPATVSAGFVATKAAFVQMAAKARAMGLRGMLGAGRAGLAGAAGRARVGLAGAAGAVGGRMRGAGSGLAALFGKGAQGGMLKLVTAGTMLVALAGPALMLGIVFGGLAVAFGGMAAYIGSKWKEISTTIVTAIDEGRITLVPLMTSLFTLWVRLKLVGEAFLGGSDSAVTFGSMLDVAVGMVDAASKGIGYFIQGLAFLVRAFGAVKAGIAGVVGVVAWMLEMLSKVPKVGGGLADTAAEMRKSQASWQESTQGTFDTAEKLAQTADKIFGIKLSADDRSKAEARAKSLDDRLKSFFKGEEKLNKPKGAKVNVGKVEMNIQLDEPDPDRVMALLVKPLMKLTQGRTQAFSTTESGA